MKKTFFYSFLFTILLFPSVTFAGYQTDLVKSIQKTFSGDFSLSGGTTLIADVNGNNIVSARSTGEVIRNNQDLQVKKSASASFDLGVLADEVDENDIPAIAGEASFGSDYYYNDSDSMTWTRLRDLNLTLDHSGDMDAVADVAEGFFEFFKFFQNQYMTLDIEEVIALFTGDSDEMASVRSQFELVLQTMRNTGETTSQAMQILLDARIFDIKKSGSEFVLTLQDEPEKLRPEKLAGLLTLFSVPDETTMQIAAEINQESDSIRVAWGELIKYLDVELRFNVNTSGVLRFFLADVHFSYTDTIPKWDYETYEIISEKTVTLDIAMNSVYSITDSSDRITFPAADTPVISITKFLKAVRGVILLGNSNPF